VTEARRLRRIHDKIKSKASKLTFHKLSWLEKISIVLGLWFLIYPEPYNLLFTIILFIPILGLILNGLYGKPSIASLVEITITEDGGEEYDLADFIDYPALILFIRVLRDYEFESFYSMIIPGTIGFALTVLILFLTHSRVSRSHKNKLWIYASVMFNIFLYSYSATYGANCVYDKSEGVTYKTEVVKKWTSKGRRGRKNYHVKVAPWGHQYDEEYIRVDKSYYDQLQTGDKVSIDLRQGALGIPWYNIKRP
jgi:hypothetical protein